MYAETPAQLVAHLSHPNGWWRDTAQRLLILKQDKSVVPALQALARGGGAPPVARFHALWTLEGLGALDGGLVREFMRDHDPRIRRQGIRASETLYKAGDKTFVADHRTLAKDADPDVAIQALLTLNLFKVPDLAGIVKDAQAGSKARGVTEIGNWITRPATGRGGAAGGRALTPDQQAVMERGGAIFNEICFTCHGDDGRGAPLAGAGPGVTMAPPLAGSPRVQGHRDYVIKTILHGLTGPVNGATYTQVMVPMGTQKDDWVAAIASYIRNSFGNSASFVSPADVARVRTATAARKTSWTVAEIESTLPVPLPAQPTWKATSSHNSAIAGGALTLAGWTTAAPQASGMWWQVELPAAVNLTEVQFDAPAGGRGFGIGSLGGGDGRVTNATAANAGGGGNRGAGAATPPPTLAPKAYRVQVSIDGRRWSTPPIAEGTGVTGQNVVTFRPVQTKFVRITQVAPDATAPAWTMLNLRLFVAK
jgi:mono/diheme cytochrome c family protein